jgi:hypothetical protein
MRAEAIGMVDSARWRGHLWLRDAGFSDSPSIALGAAKCGAHELLRQSASRPHASCADASRLGDYMTLPQRSDCRRGL